MVLDYREAVLGARLIYGTFLWVVYRVLGYLLSLCPGPVPYNRKYKKSCQEARVPDSPKEGHARKTKNIMLPSHYSRLFNSVSMLESQDPNQGAPAYR